MSTEVSEDFHVVSYQVLCVRDRTPDHTTIMNTSTDLDLAMDRAKALAYQAPWASNVRVEKITETTTHEVVWRQNDDT